MSKQPEALWLSDELEAGNCSLRTVMRPAAAELRRLHAENEQLCARLRQQSEQEPMAWIESRWLRCLLGPRATWAAVWNTRRDPELIPLYTHPHQRSPLTDEEILKAGWAVKPYANRMEILAVGRATEAAHGIK